MDSDNLHRLCLAMNDYVIYYYHFKLVPASVEPEVVPPSMSAASTPRSPRFDLPSAPANSTSHTTTDSALSDWANKIRSLQRQVDADEEAEQRRLEEEIVRT